MMASVALRLGEDVHFERLLAAVRLRHRTAADVGAWLDIGERRLNTALTTTSSASLSVIALPSRPFA